MTKIEKLLSAKSVNSLSRGHTLKLKGGGGNNGEEDNDPHIEEDPPPWIGG